MTTSRCSLMGESPWKRVEGLDGHYPPDRGLLHPAMAAGEGLFDAVCGWRRGIAADLERDPRENVAAGVGKLQRVVSGARRPRGAPPYIHQCGVVDPPYKAGHRRRGLETDALPLEWQVRIDRDDGAGCGIADSRGRTGA